MASLLSDSNLDYLIQASDADPEKIQSVAVAATRRKKGGGPGAAADVLARASRGPVAPPEAPVQEIHAETLPDTAGGPDPGSLYSSPRGHPVPIKLRCHRRFQPDPSAKTGAR